MKCSCWSSNCVRCNPPKLDLTTAPMDAILREFKARFPRLGGVDIYTMRKVLAGELVPVKVSGKNKFVLMTPEEVAPGGKLEKRNLAVRRENARRRAEARAAEAEFWKRPENAPIREAIRDAAMILKGIRKEEK